MPLDENLLRLVSFAGSCLSILLGISHIIYGFTVIQFAPNGCNFYNCNTAWRTLISFAPERFIDTFQPMLLGGIGVLYALPSGFRPEYPASLSPPSSSAMGGLFHILMALFGNLGYMFWVGIAIAAFNLLVGLAFIILNLKNGARRPKDIDEVTSSNGNAVPTNPVGVLPAQTVRV
jgi:hypothetical protein